MLIQNQVNFLEFISCFLLPILLFFFNAFVARNSLQIFAKSRLFNVKTDEIKSALFVLISERLHEFDSNRASAEAYFFGCLHAEFARFALDVNTRAISLDDESESGISFKSQVEYWVSTHNQSCSCFTNTNGMRIAAGAANLLSLAEAASGLSATEIGQHLGISRRRVNRIHDAIRKNGLVAGTRCATHQATARERT